MQLVASRQGIARLLVTEVVAEFTAAGEER
jgi:hypothetical protein